MMVLALLIRMRLWSVLNVAKDTLKRSPWLAVSLSLLGIVFFAAVYFIFLFIYHLSAEMGVLSETAYQTFYFLFLFLLAGAVPFVASTLLQSSDYSLLFSSPISSRVVVAAKLLDATITNSLQFSILGIPGISACAAALHVGLVGWLFLPLLILLFALLPALITAFGLLMLLWVIGITRLRSAVTGLNVLMAAVVCVTIVLEASHLPIRQGDDLFAVQSATLSRSSLAAHMFPSVWYTDVLVSLAPSRTGEIRIPWASAGKIALLIGGLFIACLLLGGKLLTAASLAEESIGEKILDKKETGESWKHLVSAPIAAILIKDWKYLRRDSVLLSQLTMPLILFAVPFLLAIRAAPLGQRADIFMFSSVVIGIIVFMQTSILSLSSIGLESRSFWIVLTSPNGGMRLLYAKFLMSTVFVSSIGIFLTLVAFVAFHGSKTTALLQIFVVILSAAALSGLGVGLSAMFPRFAYENPAHRVSAWAMILGFVASTGYVVVSGILFSTAWLLAINLPGGSNIFLVYGFAAAFYVGLTALVIYVPMAMGARRIERFQWDH